VIAVPQSSVLYDSGQAYVFVVSNRPCPFPPKNALNANAATRRSPSPHSKCTRRQNVQLGGRDGDLVEVVSGLELGQRIVGSGAAFLQAGEAVRVLQEAQPPSDGGDDRRGLARRHPRPGRLIAHGLEYLRRRDPQPDPADPAHPGALVRRLDRVRALARSTNCRTSISARFTVTVAQPGAAPAEMETQITQRIEAALTSVEGVKRVTSTISPGVSMTMVEMESDGDLVTRCRRCARRVQRIRADLPADITEPVVQRIDAASQPIGYYAVEGRRHDRPRIFPGSSTMICSANCLPFPVSAPSRAWAASIAKFASSSIPRVCLLTASPPISVNNAAARHQRRPSQAVKRKSAARRNRSARWAARNRCKNSKTYASPQVMAHRALGRPRHRHR
jgi:hypothetical protein